MDEEFDAAPVGGDEDDQDVDDEYKHAKLLDAISSLDGKKRKSASQRTVPASQISEFSFSAARDLSKVKLHELVGTLRDSTSHGTLKKQLRAVQKRAQVVPTPLPRHQQDRIQRSLAYETTTAELSKWDSVVTKNRKAEQLQFPLQRPDLKVITTTDTFVKRFQARTPLEKEVAALLHGSDSVMDKTQTLSAAEERALNAMSIEEAKMRRAELQKYRALLSYKEAKARWQKKIKSKRYHKHTRKSRQKEELRAIEELKKNDPEAYQEKMNQLEKDRIQERMNLKHRGGSKFIQRQKIYANYQDHSRQAVQDMYQKSRELTQKMKAQDASDGETVDDDIEMKIPETDDMGSNPWMKLNSGSKIRIKNIEEVERENQAQKESEISGPVLGDHSTVELETSVPESDVDKHEESFVKNSNIEISPGDSNSEEKSGSLKKRGSVSENTESKKKKKIKNKNAKSTETIKDASKEIDEMFEKLEETKTKEPKKKKKRVKKKNKMKAKTPVQAKREKSADEDEDEETEDFIDETLTKKSKFEDFETDFDVAKPEAPVRDQTVLQGNFDKKQDKTAEVYVDPKKLFIMDTAVKSTTLPDIAINDDEEETTESDQRMTIAEAFADDDVIEEFAQEKSATKQRQKLTDINLTLPGWGEWGGTGIKPNARKRKRFTIKAPPAPPRKDRQLGHVIINEKKDESIAKHQVSSLPFPYTSVQQFESSVRTPIGKTWNPETAFKILTKPKVVTRLGTIIKPMAKSEVFKNEKISNRKKADMEFETNSHDKKFMSKNNKRKQFRVNRRRK